MSERSEWMSIDEIRGQLHSVTQWPVYVRADGATLEIPSLDQVALPTAGNLLCVFQNGAYVVLDCAHVSAISNQPLTVES
jgi:hypothetical protein